MIPVPLQGPAIFVSHGGEAFPSLTLVLQGYGITIDLVGTTDIKNGVTSTTFKTVPDQPFSSFELTLPEGPYSALTAAGNLCTAKRPHDAQPNSSRRTAPRSSRATEDRGHRLPARKRGPRQHKTARNTSTRPSMGSAQA